MQANGQPLHQEIQISGIKTQDPLSAISRGNLGADTDL